MAFARLPRHGILFTHKINIMKLLKFLQSDFFKWFFPLMIFVLVALVQGVVFGLPVNVAFGGFATIIWIFAFLVRKLK